MRCSRTRYIKVVVSIVLVAFILIQLIGTSGIGFGRRASTQLGKASFVNTTALLSLTELLSLELYERLSKLSI